MDLNKVQLIGNVGQDPKYHKYGDKELCKFSVATTRKWNQNGERREETAWHNIVVFNTYLVEVCKKFVQKGTRIYLEGESMTRAYEKDGETKYINEIRVPQIKGELFVLARGKGWDDDNTGVQNAPASNPPYDGPPAGDPGDGFDDDIPF